MGTSYTAAERRALEQALGAAPAPCPRCGTAVERRDVPPQQQVSYVRDRVWVVCPGCGATAVVDRSRIERARPRGVPPRPAGG